MNSADLGQHAQSIFQAAIKRVRPHSLMRQSGVRALILEAVRDANRVVIVGFGKAAAAMACGLESIDELTIDCGSVIVPAAYLRNLPAEHQPRSIELLPGGHPHPTSDSVASARKLMGLASSAEEDDVVIVLISGGGSALFADFADGISLDDALRLNELLLASGASIDEVNAVRKHISSVSGGRLAAAIHPGRSISLAISDVRGNDPSVIASGPTVADSSTYQDAINVVDKYRLRRALPESVLTHLQGGLRRDLSETLKPGDPRLRRASYRMIATNRDALDAAADEATALGYDVILEPDSLVGEASDAGREIGRRLAGLQVDKPTCLLMGGETTVTLAADHGRGGRNQELALAASLDLASSSSPCLVLAAGTDGIDGPTTAAGGIADHLSSARARDAGIDINGALRRNDAYPALQQLNALVETGPTHTNVMDILIGLKLPG